MRRSKISRNHPSHNCSLAFDLSRHDSGELPPLVESGRRNDDLGLPTLRGEAALTHLKEQRALLVARRSRKSGASQRPALAAATLCSRKAPN